MMPSVALKVCKGVFKLLSLFYTCTSSLIETLLIFFYAEDCRISKMDDYPCIVSHPDLLISESLTVTNLCVLNQQMLCSESGSIVFQCNVDLRYNSHNPVVFIYWMVYFFLLIDAQQISYLLQSQFSGLSLSTANLARSCWSL